MTVAANPRARSRSAATPEALRDEILRLRAEVRRSLVERDAEVDRSLLAILSRGSYLMVGPPGVAKSMLMRNWAACFAARTFEQLLTRFTEPAEVFGPVDVARLLSEKKMAFKVDGYLPTAELAILDEIWNANSSIVNALLWILNERKFRNGDDGVIQVPLAAFFAASNLWPVGAEDSPEKAAIYDRFLIRSEVAGVRSESGRREMRERAAEFASWKPTAPLSFADLVSAQRAVQMVPYTEEALQAELQIDRELLAEGIQPSDRRKIAAQSVARAAAWLDGRPKVLPHHLAPLADVLWIDPIQHRDKVKDVVIKACGSGGASAIFGLVAKAREAADAFLAGTSRSFKAYNEALVQLKEFYDKIKAEPESRDRESALQELQELRAQVVRRNEEQTQFS